MPNISSTLIPIDTGRKKPYMLQITRQDVVMRGLPADLHGMTFAHLSDIHGGFGNTEPVYEEAIQQVNAAQPDLILFTGDYIDHKNDPRTKIKNYPIQEVLSRFKAKRGVFGSFGNHDHRRGVVGTRRFLEQSGIQVLNNENVCLEPGLWLAGVDDIHEGDPDIPRALEGIPENTTAIVLSHNPRLIEKAPNRDMVILSGHTHGSQIALPFPTPLMICWLHLRCWQVAGWYERGKVRLYVNRGLGVTGKPFRYNCPAEVALFRLVPDPSEEMGTTRTQRHQEEPKPNRFIEESRNTPVVR